MRYLEQLLKQFSDTPRNIIIKADVLRRGVQITDELYGAGKAACSTGLTTKTTDVMGNAKPVPSQFHFCDDDTTVDIKIADSPYHVVPDGDGGYQLECSGEPLGKVYFTPRPSYMDRRTSDGKECADYLTQRGPHCLFVDAINFCAYVKRGEACGYCLLGPVMNAKIELGRLPAVNDFKMVAEAVAIACEELDLRHLKLCGGALYDTRKEARLYIECLEAILDRIDPPEEIGIFSQALEKEDQLRLKEMGATNALFDMEVWDKDMWPKILPGKTKAVGWDKWLSRLEDAVDVFGRGNVGTNFVAGCESAPHPGFMSREEGFKSSVNGFEDLISRGILPWFTVWTAYPGITKFEVDDPPQADYYLRLGMELHELLEKHNFYPDLGFNEMGVDPESLGVYCYYCYSMQFTRDYPRLIGRKTAQLRKAG